MRGNCGQRPGAWPWGPGDCWSAGITKQGVGNTEPSFILVEEATAAQRGEQDEYKYKEGYQGGSP